MSRAPRTGGAPERVTARAVVAALATLVALAMVLAVATVLVARADDPPRTGSPPAAGRSTGPGLDPGSNSGSGSGSGSGPNGVPPSAGRSTASPGGSRSPGGRSPDTAGWTITVYYTAVEAHHRDRKVAVTGCPVLDCTAGTADLGSYPVGFVEAVRAEGTGRTAAGRYLNWSHDVGFWLDDAPRDAGGRSLRPFESAAADPSVLAAGTRFGIVDCGREDDGTPIDATVCARLRQARWTVTDEFTPGLGGQHHLDVYIGEETGPGFTDSRWYCTLNRATIRIG